MFKGNCEFTVCKKPEINALVECWNDCPILPTESRPVAASQELHVGDLLKEVLPAILVDGKLVKPVAKFLPADDVAELFGVAYHDEKTGLVVTACNETCVITGETRLRKSAMKLAGFTPAQIDAVVAKLATKRITVNPLQ